MDIKLHRPQPLCSRSGRGFAPGELFYSALVRDDTGLQRIDVAAEAWEGPPPKAIAWWRSRHAASGESGPTLAPIDVLLDALEAFEGSPGDEAVRYLLALELVRRRGLRFKDGLAPGEPAGALILFCRRRDRDYVVEPVPSARATDEAVAARLFALLWSGEAA